MTPWVSLRKMIKKYFEKPIKTASIESNIYPNLLKKIKKAPKKLYFRGDLPKNEICFSIVGTRRCSNYGKEIAFSFAWQLAKAGLCIASGMARGIDTFAHKGAIQAKGKTVAILGTGLDGNYIYPRENLQLAKQIIENNGCLISEYEPKTRGSNFTFPQRNRIISGISVGVLVVEAKEKSGALITAEWARKQGKKIFAIPGSIFSKNSKGCHYLIKKGAILVESPEEILKAIGNGKKIKIKNNLDCQDKEEEMILKILEPGNLDIERIIEKTGLPANKVLTKLGTMEIENKIKNLGGNIYSLNRNQ